MGSWKLIKSQEIVSSKWLKLFKRSYQLSNGDLIDDYFVLERKNFVLVVATDGDRVVLVNQYRPATDMNYWSVPAGYIDGAENPDVAAHRELTEETGLVAQSCRYLGVLHPLPGYIKSAAHVVLCSDLKGTIRTKDPQEIDAVSYFSWKEVESMLLDGRICEMQAASALLLAMLKVRQVSQDPLHQGPEQ